MSNQDSEWIKSYLKISCLFITLIFFFLAIGTVKKKKPMAIKKKPIVKQKAIKN